MSILKQFAILVALLPCSAQDNLESKLQSMIRTLRPLHARPAKPADGDWRKAHPESGESFQQYLASKPVRPTLDRGKIYVQPIGGFTPAQKHILELTVEFMGLYLCLPIVMQDGMERSTIPAKARRTFPGSKEIQLLTPYILDEVLLPSLPKDAAARIALSADDLWPGKGWNFVFGQASTRDRVGVWSIHRFGNPARGEGAFRLCLLRAAGTAVHETCHMFSMRHCTAFACCMAGSNSLEEGDRLPIWLCPECLAKLCWAVRADPVVRFRNLLGFCERNGLKKEATFYRKCIEQLSASIPNGTGEKSHFEPEPHS